MANSILNRVQVRAYLNDRYIIIDHFTHIAIHRKGDLVDVGRMHRSTLNRLVEREGVLRQELETGEAKWFTARAS